MKKKILMLVVIVLLMSLGSFAVFKVVKINNNKLEEKQSDVLTISEDIVIDLLANMNKEEYIVDDYIFRDVNVLINKEKDCFEATLVSKKAVEKVHIEIILYDEDDKKIKILNFDFTNLTENDERYLVCFVDEDLIDVHYFKVKLS